MTAAVARFCFRHKLGVVAAFAVLVALSAAVVPKLGKSLQNSGLVTIEGSQSETAAHIQSRDFQLSYETANLVFTSDRLRVTDPEYQKMVVTTARFLQVAYPELFGVPTLPYGNKLAEKALVGRDGTTAMARVPVYGRPDDVPGELDAAAGRLRQLSDGRLPTDLEQPTAAKTTTQGTGPAPEYGAFLGSLKRQQADTGIKVALLSPSLAIEAVTSTTGKGVKKAVLCAILPVAFLLLLAVGCAGGLLPTLVTPLTSLVLSLGAMTLLGQVVTLNVFGVATLALICLGLGFDHALYSYMRYKTTIALGQTPEEAVEATGGTTTRAVVGAALVAALALTPLLLLPSTTYRSFAVAGIVTLVVLAAVSLFFVPAFLGLCGNLAFAGKLPWHDPGSDATQWWPARVVGGIMNRPRLFGALAVVVGVVAALQGLKIQPATGTTDLLPRDAYEAVTARHVQEAFTPGIITPAYVYVDANAEILHSVPAYERAVALQRRIAADKDTYMVLGPMTYISTVAAEVPVASPETDKVLDALRDRDVSALESLLGSGSQPKTPLTTAQERADQLESTDFALRVLPGVGATLRAAVDGSEFALTAIPEPAANTPAARRYVERLRRYAGADYDTFGAHVFSAGGYAAVGGLVSQGVDVTQATRRWLPGILGLMALILLVALTLLLRSPLGALLTVFAVFLVAFGAFGALVSMFQWGWFGYPRTGFVEAEVPMMLVPVIVASLAGYLTVWLDRLREIPPSPTPRRDFLAVVVRYARIGFLGSAVLFVLFAFTARSDSVVLAQIGVGLCAMVVLDFVLVRMLLIPSAVGRFGHRIWWVPEPLDRHLPGRRYVAEPE